MKYKRKFGFTVIELLVVSGIISLMTVVIAQVFFTTIRTNTKSEVLREVKQTGDRTLDTMTRMIQNASSIIINVSSCPEKGEPSVIINELTLVNADGGNTTFTCDASSGIARIASASGSLSTYLTGSTVTLLDTAKTVSCSSGSTGALQFSCTSLGSVPSLVQVNFTLRQKSESTSAFDSATMSFQTTVTIRNW